MIIVLAAKVVEQLPGAAVGFVVGAFTPAIGRKIKSFLTKEATAVKAEVEKLAADVKKKV
jgi:hypothetical protein